MMRWLGLHTYSDATVPNTQFHALAFSIDVFVALLVNRGCGLITRGENTIGKTNDELTLLACMAGQK